MKAIKDQVRTLLGPTQTVSEQHLNQAYNRFCRHNGAGCHPYYSACKIADFLTINGRVQRVILSKPAGVAQAFEANCRSS
jgi:hypothetical protein